MKAKLTFDRKIRPGLTLYIRASTSNTVTRQCQRRGF